MNIFMETGFKIVEMPSPQCWKVAGIKQQGHRTAILKQHETPDNSLTIRFFCNIMPAFSVSSEGFASSGLILTQIPAADLFISKDPETDSSLSSKLQKTARFSSLVSARLLGKSNNVSIDNTVYNDFSVSQTVQNRDAQKSK
ncbi:hypothetical protein [Dyadobacter sp. LHD-138]|uniref:hypothetical protein n=1 Tax=Dyadobacter sp. LHD-138 TaxID=3071413 RepID=UPI0027E0FDD3|nr:hypothetical protein [Dyadobacter sp. LHD-138]MDQ6477513.1 hypothetical protein [Dyadobacter sp. LHD-138]